LDYFFEFQSKVASYNLDMLKSIGKHNKFTRLCLIKELDFSDIIGQRLAKHLIRQAVVDYVSNIQETKFLSTRQPLSMIFAG